MSRTFKVGDRVRIKRSRNPSRIGVVATIAGLCPWPGCPNHSHCWELDLPHGKPERWPNARAHYQDSSLEPLYDGNTKVAWSACEWQPLKVPA